MTIYELYKQYPNMLSSVQGLYPWYDEVEENVRESVVNNYYSREVFIPEIFDDVIDCVYKRFQSFLFENNKKYATLFELYGLEYDPIENYNRNEETTRKNKGAVTNKYGKQTMKNNTTSNGTDTMNYGEIKNTGTTTNKMSPFDSNNFVNQGQDDVSSTVKSHNDKNTSKSETNNSITNAEHTDIENHSNDDTIKSHIHGNIGVTTTQQMIGSSIDLANRYKFEHELVEDIVKYLCWNC